MGNKENLRILGNSGENGKVVEIGKIENRGYFGKVVYLVKIEICRKIGILGKIGN